MRAHSQSQRGGKSGDVTTYAPKNVQQTIMTVASEPRFEGERKPRRAKTTPSYVSKSTVIYGA